jgi:hypothetical protein
MCARPDRDCLSYRIDTVEHAERYPLMNEAACGRQTLRVPRAGRGLSGESPFRPTTVTAACNPGESVVSGGFAITTPAYQSALDNTAPFDRYFVYESYRR